MSVRAHMESGEPCEHEVAVTVTRFDNGDAGAVGLVSTSDALSEADGHAPVQVRRSSAAGNVNVTLRVTEEGQMARHFPISFLDGDELASVSLSIADDDLFLADRTLQLELTDPHGGLMLDPSRSLGSIIVLDDDIPFLAIVEPFEVDVVEGRSVSFRIARLGATNTESVATLVYGVETSATPDVDFSVARRVTFAVGEDEIEVEIRALDDEVRRAWPGLRDPSHCISFLTPLDVRRNSTPTRPLL